MRALLPGISVAHPRSPVSGRSSGDADGPDELVIDQMW